MAKLNQGLTLNQMQYSLMRSTRPNKTEKQNFIKANFEKKFGIEKLSNTACVKRMHTVF